MLSCMYPISPFRLPSFCGEFAHLCCVFGLQSLTPVQQGHYPFFTFSADRSMDCSDAADQLDAPGSLARSQLDGHRAMSTFSITPQKSTASLSSEAHIHVEPVLCPAPDHVVDDFVILDVAAAPPADDLEVLDEWLMEWESIGCADTACKKDCLVHLRMFFLIPNGCEYCVCFAHSFVSWRTKYPCFSMYAQFFVIPCHVQLHCRLQLVLVDRL